jgi:large subunit ribosomal protein L3
VLQKHAPVADETPSVVEAAAEEAIVTEAVETDAPATDENKEG